MTTTKILVIMFSSALFTVIFTLLSAWLLTMDGLKSFVPFYLHVLIHFYVFTYFVQESTLNSNFEWFALLID